MHIIYKNRRCLVFFFKLNFKKTPENHFNTITLKTMTSLLAPKKNKGCANQIV